MRLLLDTHAFLWFQTGDPRMSGRARRAIERPDAELLLSAASVWEMAIKSSLGRLVLPAPFKVWLEEKADEGFEPLPVDWRHAVAVEKLPFHHRDPFDRLLIAQATVENLAIVTSDPAFRPYGLKLLW